MNQVIALTDTEKNHLAKLETVIETGLKTFYEVGNALVEIREERLYRANYDTFEEYCRKRWQMSRAYAYRMIGAAEVVDNLSPIGDTLPANESQARPLTGLEPEQQREAWQKATEVGQGNVTAKQVQAAADEVVGWQPVFSLQMKVGDWVRATSGKDAYSLDVLQELKSLRDKHPRWSEMVATLPTPHRKRDIIQAISNVTDIWRQREDERAASIAIGSLEPIIRAWLEYRTGGKGIDEWYRAATAVKNGEADEISSLTAYVDRRATYRKSELRQACNNVCHQLGVQQRAAAARAKRGGLTKQEYTESLVPDLVEFLRTYTDKHGRTWQQITSVAAHTNSTPWQDITREWRQRKVHFSDDELKFAIKKALAMLGAEEGVDDYSYADELQQHIQQVETAVVSAIKPGDSVNVIDGGWAGKVGRVVEARPKVGEFLVECRMEVTYPDKPSDTKVLQAWVHRSCVELRGQHEQAGGKATRQPYPDGETRELLSTMTYDDGEGRDPTQQRLFTLDLIEHQLTEMVVNSEPPLTFAYNKALMAVVECIKQLKESVASDSN